MKKLFLAIVLAIVSLNSSNASVPAVPAYSSAGNGFYIMGQVGGGKIFVAGDFKIYDITEDGKLKQKSANGDASIWFPSAQFNWGYSHRFANDMTLGFEATIVSPALRLGYMINDRHHFVLGAHYGLTSRIALSQLFNYFKEKDLKPEQRDLINVTFDNLAGLGGSLSYEYFTQSKNFFRMQLRVDYYGAEGKVAENIRLDGESKLPFLISGKGSLWDVYVGVGFGSQW